MVQEGTGVAIAMEIYEKIRYYQAHTDYSQRKVAEPLAMWDTLTVQEKHDVAAEMIEVVYISHHSEDIEIKFGI